MSVATIKFSQFSPYDLTQTTNKVVGLSGGLNAIEQFPLVWTTATRPGVSPAYTPSNGLLGYNSDLSKYEYWNSSLNMWVQLAESGNDENWNNITATSANLLPSNGYVANNISRVIFTLPLICPFGKLIDIAGYGSGGFSIIQNTGQNIQFGTLITTTTTGSIASTASSDQLQLLCVVPNTTFIVRLSSGNFTVI